MIRDNDLNLRNVALKLLKNGKSKLLESSLELKIFDEKVDLIKLSFIDLTHAKFTSLDINGIDFSGQNLNNLMAVETSIENVKFNHCSLESANFKSSTLTKCYFDQSNLFKCNLTSIKPAMSCHFNECFLANANLELSTFEKCIFNSSDFDQINLKNCSFDHSCFEDVYNLNEDQLLTKAISFKNECLIDSNLFISCRKYFEYIKEDGIKIIPNEDDNEHELFRNILQNEQTFKSSPEDFPSNWPKFNWKHNSDWNKEIYDEINELDETSDLFKFISYYVHSTSDVYSYKAMNFEPVRLLRAIIQGKTIEFIKDELLNIGSPSNDARCKSISIKKIICIKNKLAWEKYQRKKEYIKSQLVNKTDPLHRIKWKTLRPILNKNAGECWLFHGTNSAQLITQNGFTTKYKENPFGYGASGKGIYLTDLFSKSSIYVNCPKCEKNNCKCNHEPKKGLKDYKTVFLSRVVLGNAFIQRNNSLIDMITKKDNKRYKESPPNGFNSIWTPQNKLAASDFDSNEFSVPDDQVYPEFCIFYQENEFNLDSTISSFLDINTWKKIYKQHLFEFKFCKEIENGIIEYRGLVQMNKFKYIQNNFQPLILKCFKQITRDKMYLIEEIWTQLNSELNILFKKEKTINQLEIKINAYYGSKCWPQTVSCIDRHPEPLKNYLLIRGKCYFKLEQFEKYIDDISVVIELNPGYVSDKDFETFMKTSLTCILNNYKYYKKKEYFDFLIKQILQWLNKYDLETKNEIIRMLIINDKIVTKNLLPEYLENKFNSNELGLKKNTFQNEDLNWQTKLKSMLSNEKTQVEMSWINEDARLEKGYLLNEFVDVLFDSKTGYPKTNGHEKKGKKLVILLRKNNQKLVYCKFYPDYPLRQQAVDGLCKRLSGFSCMNTLVKLKHFKQPDMGHPVLISEPLGNMNETTLDEWKNKILNVESNLDSYLFSWKFIETYLIQPRDDKGDNLCVNKLRDKCYYLVSIDSDLTFGYKFNYNLKEPSLYSLIYLCDSMKNKINPGVLKMYLSLDLDELLLEWVNDLMRKNFTINELFSQKDFKHINNLKGKTWNSFCSTCNLKQLFTQSDLIDLNNRMHKLKDILNKINSSIKLQDEPKLRIVCSNVTHFDVLESLDLNDFEIYTNAYYGKENKNCLDRFVDLDSIKANFKVTKIQINDNNSQLLTSINKPAGIVQTFIGTSTLEQIKTIEKLKEQIEILKFHINVRNKVSIDLNQIENSTLNCIRWDKMSLEYINEFLDYVSNQNVYLKQISFYNLNTLKNSKLFKIIHRQNSLEKISIKNCALINQDVLSKFSHSRNYKCNLKTVYLSELNLEIINQKLNITYLYLSKLENLKRLEITKGSTLKELYVDSCENLSYICLNENELSVFEINNFFFSLTLIFI